MAVKTSREAMFYEQLQGNRVRCVLCPHYCLLDMGESGRCRGRMNRDGIMTAVNYGMSIGVSLDPIEKKPLYHFHPGTHILSLGSNSCNLSCFFCQNFESSQQECPTQYLSPDALYALVIDHSRDSIQQVSFTYTEPFTWYEYIFDFARLVSDTDVVLVTNGFINPEPLEQLLPYIKAMNIDLKSIRPAYYTEHCGASLETVKQAIITSYASGVHIEITNLLIPGLNNSDAEVFELAEFIAAIDADIPLHISAYHPAHFAKLPATDAGSVLHACAIAKKHLSYVYAGNIHSTEYKETICPTCDKVLISTQRQVIGIDSSGRCVYCSKKIYGVF